MQEQKQALRGPAGRKTYSTPTVTRLGDLGSVTGSRIGSGNDLVDTRVLLTEPTK